MDIRDLVYFEEIAASGHFGRAAEKLGRTKPALSKCVRRLEEELGAPLFQRVGRSQVLTPPGQALLRHARHLRTAMSDAFRDVAETSSGSQGHIRIGLGTFIVDALMEPLCDWFAKESPKVTMDLRTGFNDALRNDLLEDRLDAVVSTTQPGDETRFTLQEWFCQDIVAVARTGHPLAGRAGLGIGDLAGHDWVLLGRTSASHVWLQWAFASRGMAPARVRVEIPSYRFLPPFLRTSNMLGFTPRTDLADPAFGEGLVELALPETTMRRTVSFLYRRNAYMSPAMLRLAEILRREAGRRLDVIGASGRA